MPKLWCWNCFGRGRELRLTAEPVEWGPGMYETYGVYLQCRYCGGTGEIDSGQWNEKDGYWLTKSEQVCPNCGVREDNVERMIDKMEGK